MRVSALAGLRAVGVVLVLFVVFALYGSAILQGRAQRALSAASHFRLTSPNVGLDELVLGNDSRSALAKGPGLANSAMRPGAAAPLVIVGHRTTNGGPFRHIAALHPGDTVTIRVPEGSVYTYVVQRLLVTAPGTKVQGTPGTQLLYLVSANPPYRGSGRLVVVARLTSGGSLLPVGPQTEKLPDLGGSTLALLIAIGILALIGVYWTARVFWRSRLPSWVRWASWLPAVALAYLSWQLLLGSMSRVL